AAAAELRGRHGLGGELVYTHALKGFAFSGNADAVARDSRVAYVEPDQVVAIVAQTTPTGVDRIDADLSAIANINGTDDRVNVDIAIIDTGIDPKHPDLYFYKGVTVAGAGPAGGKDNNGHGTHVAGTAAAKDNTIGVVGVAPGARLWSVKVLNGSGSGTISGVIAGVDYVTRNASQIEVANMSLGCECASASLDAAIANSVAAGVTYAVAAGNDGKDAATFSPANHPDVITVSAIVDTDGKGGGLGASTGYGADDTFASFSNSGATIELAAPGVKILSTLRGGGYGEMSGTSMASPHAAGAAALYKATNPGAAPADVRVALIAAGTLQSDPNGFTGDTDGSPEPLLNAASL
ncbi:MAG: S8 family serine peptidase, partial [Candidatus Latescibacteria bacterium]|nr:S8 family serine peptidase [Candidatus Latescibacterota bacterium]